MQIFVLYYGNERTDQRVESIAVEKFFRTAELSPNQGPSYVYPNRFQSFFSPGITVCLPYSLVSNGSGNSDFPVPGSPLYGGAT